MTEEKPLLELQTVIGGKAKTVTWLEDTGTQVPIIGPPHVQHFGTIKLKP